MDRAVRSVDDLIEAGYKLLEADDLRSAKDAVACFGQALELDSERIDSYLGRALAKIALFEFEEALDDIAVCLQAAPDQISFRLVHILLLLDLCRAQEAGNEIEDIENAIILEDKESYASFLALRSRLALADEDLESAVEDIEQALVLDGQADYYHYIQSEICQAAGDPEGALAALDRAVGMNPCDPEYLVRRGALLLTLKQPDKATRDLHQALSILDEAGLSTPLQVFARHRLTASQAGL